MDAFSLGYWDWHARAMILALDTAMDGRLDVDIVDGDVFEITIFQVDNKTTMK